MISVDLLSGKTDNGDSQRS
jgi:hypothetical protein